ncbi:MAG: hypothetical protein AAGD07_03815 [Planctomycetota bacterium]
MLRGRRRIQSVSPDSDNTHSFTFSYNRFGITDGQPGHVGSNPLDHESEPTIALTVTATDAAGLAASELFTIEVLDVNEPPTSFSLTNSTISEDADTSSPVTIGQLTVADDQTSGHVFQIVDSLFDGALFQVDGDPLKLRAETSLDFETRENYQVRIQVDDGVNSLQADFTISILDVDESPNDDFGDAPTAQQSGLEADYPTSLADNGARHAVGPLRLGSIIDAELDGQPNREASGDDLQDQSDEDGIRMLTTLLSSPSSETQSSLLATVSGAASARLDAWIDFNADGDWLDVGEQIFISSGGGLLPTGAADDGEVEDYQVAIVEQGEATATNIDVELTLTSLEIAVDTDELIVLSYPAPAFRGPIDQIASLNIVGGVASEDITIDLTDPIIIQSLDVNIGARGETNLKVTIQPSGADTLGSGGMIPV